MDIKPNIIKTIDLKYGISNNINIPPKEYHSIVPKVHMKIFNISKDYFLWSITTIKFMDGHCICLTPNLLKKYAIQEISLFHKIKYELIKCKKLYKENIKLIIKGVFYW